jgi:cytochrome c553
MLQTQGKSSRAFRRKRLVALQTRARRLNAVQPPHPKTAFIIFASERRRKKSKVKRQFIFDAHRKYRFLLALTLALAAAALLACAPSILNFVQRAQAQRRQTQTPPNRPVVRAPNTRGVNYSVFLHDQNHVKYTDAAKKISNCTECHVVEDVKTGYNIVDYPDHPACINCHRQQFFRGARPVICASCHTAPISPRNKARFDFPKPDPASDIKPIFPHNSDKHGADIFSSAPDQTKVAKGNSCSNCHVIDKSAPDIPADWIVKGKSKPDTKGTFMTEPGGILVKTDPRFVAHAACINCHGDKKTGLAAPYIDPKENQCGACHATASINPHPQLKKADITRLINDQLPPSLQDTRITIAFLNVPERWKYRISPKFKHDRDEHTRAKFDESDEKPKGETPEKTCATCHAGIQTSSKLEDLKKVSIGTCYYCHTEADDSLAKEIAARKKDPKFNCIYCHTSRLGMAEIPASHLTKPTPPAKKK